MTFSITLLDEEVVPSGRRRAVIFIFMAPYFTSKEYSHKSPDADVVSISVNMTLSMSTLSEHEQEFPPADASAPFSSAPMGQLNQVN
ncbi:hypothetical protein Y032_0009g448 [Ancylostoma ceylanicum]|uniref:Uncharacterized protein n=1 Tax=Ancylostoma ceylanicum TaxID=53326 RepID=A0A016VHR0_9BILA|nr:hypothetical protein Y032_0009g448 [Ancylostoma ceylanicum]